jgi:hypothetical protein
MTNFLEVLASFDVISRIEGFISTFVYADWKGCARTSGPAGIAAEFGRSLAGSNRWKFWVPRDAGWSGIEIERYLRRYGIVVWDRGFVGNDYYFSVKQRQANWAEYLLLRRGIPITGSLFNPLNRNYGEQHAPGDAPPAWADRGQPRRDAIDRLGDLL